MADLSAYKITIASNADVTLGNVTTANVSFGDVTITKTQDYYHGGNGLSVGSVVTSNLVVNSNANIGGDFNFGNGSVVIHSINDGITFGNIVRPFISINRSSDNLVISTSYNVVSETYENSWTFDAAGNLTLPAGGDIVDSTGTSVLGGGSGNPFNQDLNTSNNVSFNNIETNKINQNWSNFTKVTGYQNIPSGQTSDIWTSENQYMTSAKFTIQFEARTGEPYYNNFDTMTCEIVMAKKMLNNVWTAAPITVYGIVHTSENPLATFSSRIDGSGNAVLTCTPDPSITTYSYLKVHSVEMESSSKQNDWC